MRGIERRRCRDDEREASMRLHSRPSYFCGRFACDPRELSEGTARRVALPVFVCARASFAKHGAPLGAPSAAFPAVGRASQNLALLRPSPAPWSITLNAPSSATEPHAAPLSELLASSCDDRRSPTTARAPTLRGRGAGAATNRGPDFPRAAGHRIVAAHLHSLPPVRPAFTTPRESAPRWTRQGVI